MDLSYCLFRFDHYWCGNNQVPAFLLKKLSNKDQKPFQIALLRLLLALSLFLEVFGYFLITYGLATFSSSAIFIIGLIFKVGGELLGAYFQNKTGVLFSIHLQTYLQKILPHLSEIKSLLAQKGCTESEINSLPQLPSEIYQTELNSYQRVRIINIAIPIACGLALLMNGDMATGILVIILGLISLPIGERFFKEHMFRKESELRLGISSHFQDYINKVYESHIALTIKVNLLGQLPLILFAIRLLTSSSGPLLSSFFGLTQGLVGLMGTLAFQKARASAYRSTNTAKHLINSLASNQLILTPNRWEEHCSKDNSLSIPDPICNRGLIFDQFSAKLLSNNRYMLPITGTIPFGQIWLVNASSGKGKTTFLSAVMHLVEHSGNIFIKKGKECINIHSLKQVELNKKILFIKEENIDDSSRVIDLFKNILIEIDKKIISNEKIQFDPFLVDLAYKAPDNLLENEVCNIQKSAQSVFPKSMLSLLVNKRKRHLNYVNQVLSSECGNLSSKQVSAERVFNTLSSGEKRRMTLLLGLEFCKIFEIYLLILDEPFAHLDKQNILFQVQKLKEIQGLNTAPAILMVSHVNIGHTDLMIHHSINL